MPLKIALVQVVDLDKYYDVIYDASGLGTGEGAPIMEREGFNKLFEEGAQPISASYPIGILALAAYARERFEKKVEICIFDMLQQRLRLDRLIERLDRYSPDVVGLSSFSSFSGMLHRIAGRIKATSPRCIVIAGGPYCSAATERAAQDRNIDCVVYGEGEGAFVEIIGRALKRDPLRGIAGTAYLEGDKVVLDPHGPFIGDIDKLPFPAIDLIDVKGYWGNISPLGHSGPWMILFNSRGCPYRCIYCHNIFGKKTRFMSVKRTYGEVMFYFRMYGIREFHVWDDIFNLDIERGIGLSKKLAATGIGFRFLFMGGLRADIMKKGLLDEMVKAGAAYICYAVESASPRVQRLIRKNLDLKKAAEAINFTSDAGVWVNTYNMLGFPGETHEEMQRTIDYNLALRHHSIRLFKVIPQEGTGLYSMMVPSRKRESGETDMYFQYGEEVGEGVSRDVFRAIINEGRRRFYLDPARLRRILGISSPVLTSGDFARMYSLELLGALVAAGIRDASRLPEDVRPLVGEILNKGGYSVIKK